MNDRDLEVRGEFVASGACRTDDEALCCEEHWRADLEAKGWTSNRPAVAQTIK